MMRHRFAIIIILIICSGVYSYGYSDHRNRKIDSMEVVLRNKNLSKKELLQAHTELMWGYLQTDGAKSIDHAKEILRLTEKVKGEGLLSRQNAWRILGQHAYATCLYDSAMNCYQRSLEVLRRMEKSGLYSQSDVDDGYSVLYATIGNLYNIQGMTTLAMDYYLKALPIFERYGWHESVSTLYYNLGEMFLEMGNNKEARSYYQKALNEAVNTGDSLIMTTPRTGIAMTLINDGQPAEAMKQAKEAMKYYRTHIDQEAAAVMNTLVLMSRIQYNGFKDIAAAQSLMNEALGYAARQGSNTDVADVYSFQAELCLAREEWKQTIQWCLRSLETNDQDPHHNVGVYRILSQAYSELGDAAKARQYLNLMYETMESVANQQHQSALSEMQIRYETQQKEARIKQMAQQQRMVWWIGAFVLLSVIILFITNWLINRQRRRTLALESKLKGEYEERQRLGRDLHDRIGGLLTATQLSLEQNKTEESMRLLKDTTTEMRMVAHHLMPNALQQRGLVKALSEYCQVLPNTTFAYYGEPVRMAENLEVTCYSTIYELINNALRYAEATNIMVQLVYEEKAISTIVADNGKGFDVSEKNTGTGLQNIKERVKALHGNLTISSSPRHGTEVHFEIPIKKNIA